MTLVESFSGIRGIYGKELTDSAAMRYAYAFSDFLRKKKNRIKAVIGRDTRASGESLRMAIIEGLNCDIIDIGIMPTPVIENTVREFKADAGVIITASHNEPEFNGLKFLDSNGSVLKPVDMEKVIDNYHQISKMDEEEFLSGAFTGNEMKHVNKIMKINALPYYVRFLKKFFGRKDINLIKDAGLKAVIDPNGGTGIVAKEILPEFGIKGIYMNMERGRFKRKVEPNAESLKYLQKEIKKENALFAAGFDCDADRAEIMLDNGELVSGNHILALIADDVLSELKNPEKETVVVNDATSWIVKEIADSYNAKWEEVETGEINVVDAMIDFDSPVGGEGSNGGVILPPSRCRDGILTLIYICKIIAKKGKSLKELVDELPEYCYLVEKVKLKKDFSGKRERVKQHFLDKGYTVEETGDETGGLKAIKDNSWVWMRQSKTEDRVLRIIADSKDDKKARELLREAKGII